MNTTDHLVAAVLVGIGLGVLTSPLMTVVAPVLVVLGDRIPDLDQNLGTHRKTLHNVWLPTLVALGAVPVLVGFWEPPAALSTVPWVATGYATHLLVDGLGSRRGVALLYPISDTEWQSAGGVTVNDPRATLASVTVAGMILGVVVPVMVVIG
jgi:membrane-bound metal-dependent hydrolase YbcI (DUF457 family)